VSELLKVEETGFNALVNKVIREKINKEEFKITKSDVDFNNTENYQQPDIEISDLLTKDELHEQALVRSLLEFGLKEWDETQKVADYFFNYYDELEDLIDNKKLVTIINIYRTLYKEGEEPSVKNFLYNEDKKLNEMIIKIMDVQSEISPNWKDHYEGHIPTREELYKEEVLSTMNYLQLRKIKRLMLENQEEMQKTLDNDQQMICMQTHQHLKKLESEITKKIGTVIYK
jgi:DNA primase